ncbi:hypothetical protein H5119_18475 [Pseudoalteromonas sp. SG45-5]|uniref:AidA/PixA family protein n=1 Tax=unclassified Pseudoalteromonas TaxID=194690 RepID=UPI0015FC58BA|nr:MULTISPECIES: AidA/PixA family protein [unclassified Pseudoalteromonas]MBB1387492.1 hypothetical protein [Pseudoalteromonas sp. SG45-5]MBB1395677.1 hypothetical protein [Pseudoalteromonas sp. SG44-4]MBB1448281.1 hypothetical protein [Pseudoalteromonas sp. SG41-6]
MNVISIILNVDQEKIYEYWLKKGKPSSIAMKPADLLKYLYMVSETGSTFTGHATSDLIIEAKPGDEVRWYETPIQPSAAYSICIKDIITHGNWAKYVVSQGGDFVQSRTEQTLRAYYIDKELRANSASMDYSSAKIIEAEKIGTLPATITYDFNLSLVEMVNGIPTLRCTLTFDPGIKILN